MFSSRFHWDAHPNRLTQLLREKKRAGVPVLDLTESNPTRADLAYPAEVMAALSDQRVLLYEPSAAGALDARGAISRYYAVSGRQIEPDRILLTASTSEAYAYLFKLLCDSGDQVLVPRPSYPLFEFLATMENVEARQYPLAWHGEWSIDRDALKAAITDRTRAIVLVNPNNPTGSYVKWAELEWLAEVGLPLISDEVFCDYAFSPDPSRVDSLLNASGALAFSMSGLSKVAGLPQMKLGWIAVSGPETARREAMEKLEWIADTYLSVSTPVQCAAPALLAAGMEVQRQIRERTMANLAWAQDALAGSAAGAMPVEGGWYLTIRMPQTRGEEEWALEMLDRENVLVQPGFFYDFETEAFLIVSLLTPPAIFREGLDRLKRRLEEDQFA